MTGDSDAQVAPPPRGTSVPLIEIKTSFGMVAATEEALVAAVMELLRTAEPHRATPDDLLEAVSW